MKSASITGALLACALAPASALAQPAAPQQAEPPPPPAPAVPNRLQLAPVLQISGGLKGDIPLTGPTQHDQPRVSTIALALVGIRGAFDEWIQFESRFIVNGGVDLHGTSTFEGQAALQVWQQTVRLAKGAWMGEVGRVVDEASVDFFSSHVADALLQDPATRDPLLYSGFNIGNGVRGTVEVAPGLRLGLAFNAGNPVSMSSSLVVGGSFPPFDRVYLQPYQAIGKTPNNYPDDTFHMMMITPSILYRDPLVEAHVALQGYELDTDMTKTTDNNVRGYNARANLKLRLAHDLVNPFVNASFDRNDTVSPTDVSQRAPDKYVGITFGGGIDLDYGHRFPCAAGCPDGIGLQFEQVQFQVGSGDVTTLQFANLGTTYWLSEHLAAGARVAAMRTQRPGTDDEGELSGFLTLRYVM